MGRETKLLLALLATLAGVFVGALSVKLFVPRPPAGAGPDVAVDQSFAESHELVEPPSFSGRKAATEAQISAGAFASAPAHAAPAAETGRPIEMASSPEPPPMEDGPPPESPPAVSAFVPREIVTSSIEVDPSGAGTDPIDMPAASPAAPPRRDPFVTAASHDVAGDAPPRPAVPASVAPAGQPSLESSASAPASTYPASTYVAAAGDSWWNLAERAYGDGRLYRALFAWNRVLNPRVSLAPGTPLEIPPKPRLEAAWPALMPAP